MQLVPYMYCTATAHIVSLHCSFVLTSVLKCSSMYGRKISDITVSFDMVSLFIRVPLDSSDRVKPVPPHQCLRTTYYRVGDSYEQVESQVMNVCECESIYIGKPWSCNLMAHVIPSRDMASCGHVWSDEEVAALLAAWSKESIQRQLLWAVQNTIPYKAIAKELTRQGFSHNFKPCWEKVKTSKRNKEVVDTQKRSGAGVSSDDDSLENVPVFFYVSRGSTASCEPRLSRNSRERLLLSPTTSSGLLQSVKVLPAHHQLRKVGPGHLPLRRASQACL